MKFPLVFVVILCSFFVGQTISYGSFWEIGTERKNEVLLFSGKSHYFFTYSKGAAEITFPNKFEKPQFIITRMKHWDGDLARHHVNVTSGGIRRMRVTVEIRPARENYVLGWLQIYGIHKSCIKK